MLPALETSGLLIGEDGGPLSLALGAAFAPVAAFVFGLWAVSFPWVFPDVSSAAAMPLPGGPPARLSGSSRGWPCQSGADKSGEGEPVTPIPASFATLFSW